MGWDYINRIAYGVEMIAWDNNEIEPLLTKYKNILSYDKDMASAPKGSIFVYVDSTYKILDEDHGSYSGGRLDTLGGTFNRPRHECIHERNKSLEPPTLTHEEQTALKEVETLSRDKCCWVHDARVYH